jgi:hypothetical protein
MPEYRLYLKLPTAVFWGQRSLLSAITIKRHSTGPRRLQTARRWSYGRAAARSCNYQQTSKAAPARKHPRRVIFFTFHMFGR